MTGSHVESAPAPAGELPALRAFGLGAAVVVAGVAAVVALGPAVGLAEPLPAFVGLGAGAALLAGVLATALHARATRAVPHEADPRHAALRLQGLLGAAFLIKLLTAGACVAALSVAGVKFPSVAAFALAFAGAALVLQLVTVALLARALGRRSRARAVQDQ